MAISLSNFNWIDGVVLFFVFWGVFWGIKRGLTGELLKITGVIIAFFAAIRYSAVMGAYINEQEWADQDIVNWLAFFLIFLVVALAFCIVAKIPYLLLRKTFLGALDRFLGAFFGAARGLVMISVILTCVVIIVGPEASKLVEEDSFSGGELVATTYLVWDKLYQHKDEMIDGLEENIQKSPEKSENENEKENPSKEKNKEKQ